MKNVGQVQFVLNVSYKQVGSRPNEYEHSSQMDI